jgi:hypothetical protein
MSIDKIAKVEGYLKGIGIDIREMKEDIKEIKNNDKDKLERITKLETEARLMNKWRQRHINANIKHKEGFTAFKKQYANDKDQESKWRVTMLIAIILALFDLITRALL